MKAIRVHQHGDPQVMQLEEVPDPQPAPGLVVVQVRSIGVNPVDTYIRAGGQGYKAPLPYTPGFDAAGVVEAVGPGVTRVTPGDRVYTAGTLTGAYAQKAACRQAQVHPLPPGLTFAQGAALGVPYATAYRALFQRAHTAPGESVLVHGASGGVGIAAVQLARAAGLTVIATAGSEQGRRLALDQGAHHALDHHDPDHLHHAHALTRSRGIDAILEMLANVNLGSDLTALAPWGRVVVIGSRGPIQINPRDTMGRNASILGMSLLTVPDHEMLTIHAAIIAGLENRSLRPVVRCEFPLSHAPEAHRTVMLSGALGKIVLNPDE